MIPRRFRTSLFVVLLMAYAIVLLLTPQAFMPMVAAAALLVVPAAFLLAVPKVTRRFVEGKPRALGQCHACGYDLTATRGVIQCPECGTVVDRFAAFGTFTPEAEEGEA